MPKIDMDALPWTTGSSYPAGFADKIGDRRQKRLGEPYGLTQFGANLVRLGPRAMSSLRHWHERQDEFLVVVEGFLVLVDDTGESALVPGDCCAFPAGDANGHHIVNRSDRDGAFVVVGTRTQHETGWYSDLDLKVTLRNGTMSFSRRDGSPLGDTDPLVPEPDFVALSDRLTQALLTADTELFASLCSLPHRVVPRSGQSYTLTTRAEMDADMLLYGESLKLHHVTDIFRVQRSLMRPTAKTAIVTAEVHLMAGAQRIVDPYEITFTLLWDAGDWRVSEIESALGHINWTLGQSSLPESGRFEET